MLLRLIILKIKISKLMHQMVHFLFQGEKINNVYSRPHRFTKY